MSIIGAALCAYGKPAASAYTHRGVRVTLALRMLPKRGRQL
jgi:hypothetical protein